MSRVALLPIVTILLPATSVATAAEMKDTLTIDRANIMALHTMFGSYGYRPGQTLAAEADSLRLRLPSGISGVTQTGVYSLFTLAGDCEVTCTYELVNLQPPRKGYGSSVGLAFDAGDEIGRASIQRVKTLDGNGYALQTHLAQGKGEAKEENRFVGSGAKQGRMGLRRVKNELIFLRSDEPAGELEEVDRLPFTKGTIQAVRVFVDPGGSPTVIDVRVKQIEMRAEQITGGVPETEHRTWSWWWLLLISLAGAGFLVWRWRTNRE